MAQKSPQRLRLTALVKINKHKHYNSDLKPNSSVYDVSGFVHCVVVSSALIVLRSSHGAHLPY